MKKTLPWGALIVGLPLIFFAVASFALIFSVSGLIMASSADSPVTVAAAGSQIFSSPPPSEGIVMGESTVTKDARPTILRKFLDSYHSPLMQYSNLILQVSEKYNLDWRLVVAISGAESTFGQKIPDNCYNAWGWGIHSRGTLCFSSWEEGIKTVAQGLREKFLSDGLTTPEQIMARYAPLSDGSWAYAVKYFMGQLEHADYYQ